MGALHLGKRHDVTVLALGKDGDPLVPPGETRLAGGIRVVRLPWSNSYLPTSRKPSINIVQRAKWHLKTALGAVCKTTLSNFLKRENFDLIYAQNSAFMQPALFQASEETGIPICLHLRDYALLCPKTSMFRRGDNCEKQCFDCSLLTRRMTSTGAGMTAIAVSDALRRRFLENDMLTEAHWHVMHNTNTAADYFDKSLLHRKKPASFAFTFAYLGAVAEEKGLKELIYAFTALPAKHGARLVIAGRGRACDETHLKSIAKDANIEFRGFVPPQEIYRIADAVVVPSRWHEPQSRVLIEAPMHGVPVIGSNRGGTPEILRNSETGWCYDPDEKGALGQLLNKALEIGQHEWWARRNELFPGIRSFKGTSEESDYYTKLEDILLTAAGQQRAKIFA